MALTIVELYEALKRLDETGLLDTVDGEVMVAYQPNYPLVAAATGCGFIVKDGAVEFVIGCGLEGGDYASGVQTMAFDGHGDELVEEEEYEDEE